MRLGFRKYIAALLLLGAFAAGLSAQESYTYANKTLRTRSWGNYPIVLSNEVKGGIHHIAGLPGGDLSKVNDSIPAERRQTGMLCVVGDISWTASDIVLMYNGTDWNRINYMRVWESGETYFNGQNVFENGKLYVARVANPTSQPSANATEWHDLSSKLDQILVSDADANDGLTYNTANNEYDLNVDNSTIEISGDNLQVSDLGITTGKLANDAITAQKLAVTGNGTSGQILSSSADGSFFWEDASNLNVNPSNIDLSSAHLLIGNAIGKAEERTITGDVAITNEGVTTVAGLVTNANAIAAETSARIAADAGIAATVTAEALARTNADNALQSNIDAEEAARIAADNTLQNNIDAEETARIAADGVLTTGLASEISNRSNADAALQSELDATQTGAGLGAGGAYTANGSATYIATSTSLVDADNDLDAAIKANADAISGNTSDLQDEVDAIEAGAGLNADGDYVANGSSNYISGAASLNAADVLLDTEVKTNADAISTETTARIAADAGIAATVTAEALARTNADNALQSNIDDEEAARIAADNTLQNNIDAEETARIAADGVLTTGLASEISNRSNADAAIQSELDATQTGAGLGTGGAYAANGSATYIATSTSLVDADNDLDAAIKANADAISGNTSDLQDEVDAIEAGAGLNADGDYVANGSANYISGAASLNAADVLLDTQLKNNADAITAETSARIAADAGIAATVTAEALARTNADNALQSNIDAEEAARIAADNTLQNNIDAEETARIAADGVLTTGLASEISNRSNADAAIQSELDATQTGAGLGTGGAYAANGSATYIATSTSLVNADNDLDAAIKANADAISGSSSDLQDEVDAIEAGAGLNADGDYVANGSANYISGAASLNAADVLLDTQMKNNADGIATNSTAITAAVAAEAVLRNAADNALQSNVDAEESARIAADNALQAELNATQAGAGLGTDGSYTTKTLSNYITTSTSLVDADDDLDAAIKSNADAINSINTNTSDVQTEIDAIETGAGLNANGTYAANGGTNYISAATSLNNADILLDAQAKTNADNITTNATAIAAEATARIAGDAGLQTDIDAINQLNSAQIYVGNSSNAATARTMNGDANLSNTGALNINSNVIGANELNVSGNGSSGQVLSSDGAGGLNWQTFNVNSSNVSFVNSAGTLTSAQQGVVMCNGNFTLTLPNASTEGLTYTLKNIGTNKVIIDGNGSQTIDGELTFPLDEQFASITLVSYNSAWYVVDRQSKNTVHIGNPGINGSWRITLGTGNTLSFEQYDTSVGGGSWVFKMEIED